VRSSLALRSLLCVGSLLALAATRAHASEPPPETANGVGACRAFEEKNEKELAAFEAAQPPHRYHVDRPSTILRAPWGGLFSWIGSNPDLVAATLVPALGTQVRNNALGNRTIAFTAAWPWTFPIGPVNACSRKVGTFVVNTLKPHRLMLEPGIITTSGQFGGYLRGGYRFLYHPTDWVVGPGLGFGATAETGKGVGSLRPMLSPEAVLHFGHCCEPSYFALTVRADIPPSDPDKRGSVFTVTLGYTFL